MPTLAQIKKERESKGEKVKDFLSQDEVDALLKGVTDEPEDDAYISEDDWAAALAEDACREYQVFKQKNGWESINMPISDWQKIVGLIETQPLGEFYEIYTRIISNLPRT